MSTKPVPPGQRLSVDFPVLDLGVHPEVDCADWRLRLFGMVTQEVELGWRELMALPQIKDISDFHCVTHWSCHDLVWEGVRASEVLALAQPLPEAGFVTLHSYDGYTTNLPLSALMDMDVILAHGLEGGPLSTAHGGPVRMVVPKRYGWKSAKWLKAMEFHAEDRPGYWEVRGYHNEADPWREERFSE